MTKVAIDEEEKKAQSVAYKGYTLSSLQTAPNPLDPKVIYIDVVEKAGCRYLKYMVMAPCNKKVTSEIPWSELPKDFPKTTDEIIRQNRLSAILKITSRDKHTLRPEEDFLNEFRAQKDKLNIDQMNQLFCQFDKKSLIHTDRFGLDEKIGLVNTASYRRVVQLIRDYAKIQLDQQIANIIALNQNEQADADVIKLLKKALKMEIFNSNCNNFRWTRFWETNSAVSHIQSMLKEYECSETSIMNPMREVNI